MAGARQLGGAEVELRRSGGARARAPAATWCCCATSRSTAAPRSTRCSTSLLAAPRPRGHWQADPDSEARRLDLLPQTAPLAWDELMHHAGVPARARAPALERENDAAPRDAAPRPPRCASARPSGPASPAAAVSNGSLTCDRSFFVSTSTSGPSSTADRPCDLARHADRRRLARHRRLRRADLARRPS